MDPENNRLRMPRTIEPLRARDIDCMGRRPPLPMIELQPKRTIGGTMGAWVRRAFPWFAFWVAATTLLSLVALALADDLLLPDWLWPIFPPPS